MELTTIDTSVSDLVPRAGRGRATQRTQGVGTAPCFGPRASNRSLEEIAR